MSSTLKRLYLKTYQFAAEKHPGICREYKPYVESHLEEHSKHRFKHLWRLFRLNVHYRILRRDTLLYPQNAAAGGAKKGPARHLPYLKGPESEASGRPLEVHLVSRFRKYDVVSFDIFDTLILRPFAAPQDLFMLIGKRLKRMEFHRIRIDAEKKAREAAMLEKGNREVTIDDIYTIIEERTGIPKEEGIQAEFRAELDYCFANPYMKRVFDMLVDQGKKVIITSDMYFPHDMMEQLLKNAGYEGWDKLYVSCDYGCSKSTESLYKYVLRDYEGQKIIHVGDNYHSDIKCASAIGLDTYHYKNVHEIGKEYRADGMSDLTGSAYAGLVNCYLHNGADVLDPYYEYGYIYGGLYVTGFINWMHRKAKNEGIEKIIFLARDGDIYQRVFNYLFDDVPNEYFLWSRIANTKYTLIKNREDFLKRLILYRAVRKDSFISLGSMLATLNLHELEQYMSDYSLTEDVLVTMENLKPIERLFLDHWDLVLNAYNDEKAHVEAYIRQKVGNCKKIAIVDVGWLGSGPMGLKYLIEDEMGMDCEVHCWQAGSRSPRNTDMITELMDGTIEPYMFSRIENRNNFDTHNNTNKGTNNMYFELFTQSKTPSFSGWREDGSFVYDIPEVENYVITDAIHNGMMDFCIQYTEMFKNDPVMMHISGYDAYLPYRMIIRDLGFIRKYFSDLSYARGIGGDEKKQSLEKLGGMIP